MKTSTLLGLFTGLALVSPFVSGLQAQALSYPGHLNPGGSETCWIRSATGGRETIQIPVTYNGPGEVITLDGVALRPLGNRLYVDDQGNQFKQEPSMDNLVLSAGGGKITCTLDSQAW